MISGLVVNTIIALIKSKICGRNQMCYIPQAFIFVLFWSSFHHTLIFCRSHPQASLILPDVRHCSCRSSVRCTQQ